LVFQGNRFVAVPNYLTYNNQSSQPVVIEKRYSITDGVNSYMSQFIIQYTNLPPATFPDSYFDDSSQIASFVSNIPNGNYLISVRLGIKNQSGDDFQCVLLESQGFNIQIQNGQIVG
jgi:hypothetical protein